MSKQYFGIKELVSPEIYDVLGDGAWRLIPASVCASLNALRDAVGVPLIVNNWATGGLYRYSGIRPRDCPEGADMSRHKMVIESVTAFDIKCCRMDKLNQIIKERFKEFRISRIENPEKTKSWIHCEFSSIPVSHLVVFDP